MTLCNLIFDVAGFFLEVCFILSKCIHVQPCVKQYRLSNKLLLSLNFAINHKHWFSIHVHSIDLLFGRVIRI